MSGEIYSYDCFISPRTKYCLIDGSGDIRATAPDLRSIMAAQIQYGWGEIHKVTYDSKTLTIGRKVEVD